MTSAIRPKFALLAGAVLAVTAGSVAIAAVDAPPAPPALPTPPAPPAPPMPPESGPRVVIVEKHGGEGGRDYVRTVTRDGKTFVFQTDRELSDEEVERRVEDAENRLPPVPPMPPVADGASHRVTKQRVVVMNDNGETVTDVVTEEGARCRGEGVMSDVDTSAQDGGKLTRVRLRICGGPEGIAQHARSEAIAGVRQAREEIARDKSLSDAIRRQVLKELDAEMARLIREG